MTKRIGWHGWHPVLDGDLFSADPNGIWMGPLAKYLRNFGFESVWLGDTHGITSPYFEVQQKLKNIDCVFFSWRWPLPDNEKYKERNQAYQRQWQLMEQCHKFAIPFIIHNQDYKIELEELREILELGGRITAPAVHPPDLHQTLHFPMVFQDAGNRYGDSGSTRGNWITYIGNNYERMDTIQKYLAFDEDEIEVLIYGNWLNPTSGDGRPDPKTVLRAFPHVRFKGKCAQSQVIDNLKIARATIQVGKKSYMQTSLIALRWLEAAAAGTVSLIPTEWSIAKEQAGTVRSKIDVINTMQSLSDPTIARSIADRQRQQVMEWCDPYRWVELFREMTE